MFDSEIVVAKCMREVKKWDLNVRSYTMSIEERKCLCSVKEIRQCSRFPMVAFKKWKSASFFGLRDDLRILEVQIAVRLTELGILEVQSLVRLHF